MDDLSRVGEARRHAATLAADMAWGELEGGRLALVVTELGTNLQRHAHKGRLLIAARPQTCQVEVIAIDEGPGIADIALAMRDGHSSGTTPGTGLGAVRRLASRFDIHSSVPDGTVSVALVGTAMAAASADDALELGAICLPAPHESVSGDTWAAATHGTRTTVLMADGLGHGPEAAKAADAAVEAFAAAPEDALGDIVQRLHRDLRTTRGAAVCLLRVDVADPTITYTGAGNIAGRILSGVFDRSVVTQHGTAGVQIRRPETTSLEWPAHAIVVMHSDGIETRWTGAHVRSLLQGNPTLVAAVLWRDHTRHRDDATVLVMRRKD